MSSWYECFYHNLVPTCLSFSGKLILYRQGCGNSTYTAYSIANSVTWSPKGYAYPAESHAHYIMQIWLAFNIYIWQCCTFLQPQVVSSMNAIGTADNLLHVIYISFSLKSKRVWSGNITITHSRPTHCTMRMSHRTLTVTRHQEDN